MLFGAFFGIIFPTVDYIHTCRFISVFNIFFFAKILFCTLTTEVKIVFSNPKVEITISQCIEKENK